MATRTAPGAPLVITAPDDLVGIEAGQAVVDLSSVPTGNTTDAIANASTLAGTTLTDALDGADVRITDLEAQGLAPEVLVVRSAADLPVAVAGVRTIPSTRKAMWLVDNVSLGTDRLVVPDSFAIFGTGAGTSGLSTANASPMITGKRLLIRDTALANTAGACVRSAGTIAADPAATLRVMGCTIAGATADGAIQAHDVLVVTVKDCFWTGGSGVGVRFTGTWRLAYFGESMVRGNAAAFTWLEIPGGGAATLLEQTVVHALSFDLASGGTGISADPAALPEEGLHVEICVFPDPTTPGIGPAIAGVTADDPECHFAGNLNLENTHVRGALTIAHNATATTITDTVSFFKLAGTTTLADASLFDSPESGTLRSLAPGTIRARLTAIITLSTAVNNQDLHIVFGVRPGGVGAPTLLTAFEQEGVTGGSAGLRINGLVMMAIVSIAQDDWIDVRVQNLTGTNAVTWTFGQVFAEQING